LRNLIFAHKSDLQEKTEENNRTQNGVNLLKDALQKWESTSVTRQVAPSDTSRPGLTSRGTADAAPPIGAKKKQFSEVLSGKNEERHKLTVKSKENQATEEIKKLLKIKIDPVNMKIGIRIFKSLKNGNVLIEADSKEEIERLHSQIRDKCGNQIETYPEEKKSKANHIQRT